MLGWAKFLFTVFKQVKFVGQKIVLRPKKKINPGGGGGAPGGVLPHEPAHPPLLLRRLEVDLPRVVGRLRAPQLPGCGGGGTVESGPNKGLFLIHYFVCS